MLSVKQDFFYNMNRTSKMEALFEEKMLLRKKVDYQEEWFFFKNNKFWVVLQWTDYLEKFSWYI